MVAIYILEVIKSTCLFLKKGFKNIFFYYFDVVITNVVSIIPVGHHVIGFFLQLHTIFSVHCQDPRRLLENLCVSYQ